MSRRQPHPTRAPVATLVMVVITASSSLLGLGCVEEVPRFSLSSSIPDAPNNDDNPADTGQDDNHDAGGAPQDASTSQDAAEEDAGTTHNDAPPNALTVRWANAAPDDRVTRHKVFVIEFDAPDAGTPTSWAAQTRWSRRFPATVHTVGAMSRAVPTRQRWLDDASGRRRFRPAIEVSPADAAGWPEGAPLVLTLRTGPGQAVTMPFRTLDRRHETFQEVDLTIPPGDCAQCFPYPVKVKVFLPPGYMDPTHLAQHNPAPSGLDDPGGSLSQRYPVSVLLHDAGTQQGYVSVARAAAAQMAAGLVEPMIIALPDGRLDEATCAQEPDLRAQGCHTRFLGLWRFDNTILSYTTFLADDLRAALRERFRVRGADDDGEVVDEEAHRRAHTLSGVSAGGYGSLINAWHRPEAWYGSAAIIAGVVSAFNPYAHYGDGLRPRDLLCPTFRSTTYPRRRVGQGFQDLTGVDPETGRRRRVSFQERETPPGAANCFQAVPNIPGQLVRAGLCRLDVACMVDPEAPSDMTALGALKGHAPFHGNLYFDTGIMDGGGPLAAFIDLDELLDRADVDHSFVIEDRGALTHGGVSVRDRYHGQAWIHHSAGGCQLPPSPGNGPRIYPWLSAAMQGHAATPFNSLRSSAFSVAALDEDRDGVLDFDHADFPDLRDAPDNCPEHFNPDQGDRDDDGVGDLCDDDLDGDMIPDDEDDCLFPTLPDDPDAAAPAPSCDQDRDADEVPDDVDRCPTVFDPEQRDIDNDGVGDLCDDDLDGDMIPNERDRCPRVPDPDQADFDDDGAGDLCAPAGLLQDVDAWCER